MDRTYVGRYKKMNSENYFSKTIVVLDSDKKVKLNVQLTSKALIIDTANVQLMPRMESTKKQQILIQEGQLEMIHCD